MLTLNTEQKVNLTIKPLTVNGKPAKLDGVPTWESSDVGVITLVVAADGLSADAITTDGIGTSTVKVTADADLGEGVENIAASLDVESVHARATNLGLVAGEPQAK